MTDQRHRSRAELLADIRAANPPTAHDMWVNEQFARGDVPAWAKLGVVYARPLPYPGEELKPFREIGLLPKASGAPVWGHNPTTKENDMAGTATIPVQIQATVEISTAPMDRVRQYLRDRIDSFGYDETRRDPSHVLLVAELRLLSRMLDRELAALKDGAKVKPVTG